MILENNKISIDLYVKEKNSHQCLHPSSCHPYHCVKSIPYSQASRLNRICSKNIFYDNRCNQLEKWLSDRNYKQKLVREQIRKARARFRETLLNNERDSQVEDRLVLNLTYHLLVIDFQKALNKAQILLTPNEKPPMIGWRKAHALKDYLVRAKITNRDTEESKSALCNNKRYQVCQLIEETYEFEDAHGKKYTVRKGVINCNTDFTVYKFHCSFCSKQYLGSNITDFEFDLITIRVHFVKYLSRVNPHNII